MKKKDADYLWNLMPDWVKQQSIGLGPMSYGTTTYEGDVKVSEKVKALLFNDGRARAVKPAALPTFVWDGNSYFLDIRLGQIRRTDGPKFTDFVDITNEDLKAHIRGVRAEHYGQFYVRGLDD